MKYLPAILSLFVLLSCSPKTIKKENQGITGKVTWTSGNQMPSPDRKITSAKPIQREVLIYELTNKSQTEGHGPIYKRINSKLIKKLVTDTNGAFQVELPAGKYSVFIKDKDGYFANSFDTNNNIKPVNVMEGKMTDVTINVNYDASY